jgi:hypothetical protein
MLNSSLFFWWWYTLYEGYHCGRHEIHAFPAGLNELTPVRRARLGRLADRLMADLVRNQQRKICRYRQTGKVVYDEFSPRRSRPILDAIDRVLAEHYGFTDEELDFILNHDIKYRSAGRATRSQQ